MVGKGRRSALLTLVERKSGYVRIGRVDSLKSDMTRRVAKRRMKDLPPSLRRSVTFDNGKEFAEHDKLARGLGWETYFADPYSSWQRGTNENTNGLIRDFFPKSTDFSTVPAREIKRVQRLLNERPRKVLNWRTPKEVFASLFEKRALGVRV